MEDSNKKTEGGGGGGGGGATRMNRPSYESKISLSLPISNSNTSSTSSSTSTSSLTTKASTTIKNHPQTDIDLSLLDYKSVDDFLYYISTKSEIPNISTHLAKQLKASRSLLSLSKFLIFGNSPKELITKIVDSTSAIIDAERVLFLELDQETTELIYFKPQESSSDIIYRIRDGIECKFLFFISSSSFSSFLLLE